jgi:hypothetical protein
VVRQGDFRHVERRGRDARRQGFREVGSVDRGFLVQRVEEEVDPVDEDGGRSEDLDDEEKDSVREDAAEAWFAYV